MIWWWLRPRGATVLAAGIVMLTCGGSAVVLELVVAPQSFARPLAAPPGLPQDRADALRKAFDATVTDPEFVKEATKLQLEPELVSAAQLEDILRRLYATPAPIVERAPAALGGQ
jgi:hypothetical protein